MGGSGCRAGGRGETHPTLLTAAIAHARRTKQEIHVVTSDIRKAFDTVPQEALLDAAAKHGYPAETLRRARLLLEGARVRVRTPYGLTDGGPNSIRVRRGCKQGCPLSPILFCLFMNMFVQWMAHPNPPAQPHSPTAEAMPKLSIRLRSARPPHCDGSDEQRELGDAHVDLDVQAYMDDLALLADSAAGSASQLSMLATFLHAHDMRLNYSKCTHAAWSPHAQPAGQPAPLLFDTPAGGQATVHSLTRDECFKYLGYQINMAGTWHEHERALSDRLKQAVARDRLASRKPACKISSSCFQIVRAAGQSGR